MSKVETAIKQHKWMAILRSESQDAAVWAARAAIAAGAPILELTYSIPQAEQVLKILKKEYPTQMIGMGTVSTVEQGKKAQDAGADFLVSPHIDETLVKAFSSLLYIPGAYTPTEIMKAQSLGVRWCKIFPASVYGPNGLKTLLGPMPTSPVMHYIVTGGVTEANSKDYLKAGASAVGVGSNVFSDQALGTKDEHHVQKSVKAWQNSLASASS